MRRTAAFVLVFALFLFSVFSSSSEKHNKLLIQADSLQAKDYNDSALEILEKVVLSDLSANDSAYYYMLDCFVKFKLFKPNENDSTINYSIKYYERTGDKVNLARSYVYKASIIERPDRYAEMAILLKKAEDLIMQLGNDEHINLLLRIYSCLSYLNSASKNLNTALDYSEKVLELAKKSDSRRWIGYSYIELSYIYGEMGQKDSSNVIIKRVAPYVNYISKGEQAVYYQILAQNYEESGKSDSAIYYMKKALGAHPLPHFYGTMARMYTKFGLMDNARSMWEKVFKYQSEQQVVLFMKPYAEWLYKIGEKDSAWNVAMKIPTMKDSMMHVYQTETVLAEQKHYEKQKAAIIYRHKQRMMVAVAIIALILLILTVVIAYAYSQRQKKLLAEEQRKRIEHKMKVVEYERLTKKLRDERKSQTKEIKLLQRKIEKLRMEQESIIVLGRKNYEWIEDGNTTAKWKVNDFRAYLDYYRTLDLTYVLWLETAYDSLSPSQMFHMVLEHGNLSKEEMMRVMNYSTNSYRVACSRIKKKLLPD